MSGFQGRDPADEPENPKDLAPTLGSNESETPEGGTHQTIYDTESNERISWDTTPNEYGEQNYSGGGHTVDQATDTKTDWSTAEQDPSNYREDEGE